MNNTNMFGSNKYYLMNKDNPILLFELNEVAKEIKRFGLLPLGFKDIQSWLEDRRPPKHRAHIKKLLELCGCETLEGYVQLSYALSLNDTFWVKSINNTKEWKDVSLYTNDFNETISRLAFDGGLRGELFSSTSPEFGTDGSFAKCWIRNNEEIRLLKCGSTGGLNTGYEPYSEYLASQIAKEFLSKYVKYSLGIYHGRLVSSCNIFTTEEIGYCPYYRIFTKSSELKIIYDCYKRNNIDEDFRRMIIFDALILNEDRHTGNHGVLFNNQTNEILGMAPVFDNNVSLLCYAMNNEFELGSDYIQDRSPRIGFDFIKTAKEMLTPKLKRELHNLYGIELKVPENYKGESQEQGIKEFPQWRLDAINKIVNNQIKLILS